jgi:ParB-like chromosome segregation protein Spo0J
MAEARKAPEVLNLATAAKTESTSVPLNSFVRDDPIFCLRPNAEFDKAALQPLMDSLALEGQQVPVEAFVYETGEYVLTKGYRRVSAMILLATENHPRFKPDMPVSTIIVKEATQQDLLLRAVLDNETRKNLGPLERLEVVKKMTDLHVPVQRAAAALGVSVKTLERDQLLVNNEWMHALVKGGLIVPSTAIPLLAAAKSERRLDELKEDLLGWITETQRKMKAKAQAQAKDDSDSAVAALVRKAMTRDLVLQWLKQLKQKERFTSEVSWDFGAGIDTDTNQLLIEGVKVNLARDPLDRLAKVASKLARVQKGLMDYLKTRHELEQRRGPQDVAGQEADTPYDLAILREAGLGDLADELGQENQPREGAEGTHQELNTIDLADELGQESQPRERAEGTHQELNTIELADELGQESQPRESAEGTQPEPNTDVSPSTGAANDNSSAGGG